MVTGKTVRRSEGGFSLLELVVALVILGLLMAAVFPYLTSRPMNLRVDTNDLVANLRLARDLAISRTTRYRVVVTSRTSYALERLDESTGQWAQERTVRLRENVQFARTTRNGQSVEFDSRGRIPQSADSVLLPFTLEDTVRRQQRSVRVSNTGGVWEE